MPTADATHVELMLAVWTPGSYLVREYARHLERVEARSTGGDAAPRREDAQEPLARRVCRRGRRPRALPGLRPRDDRAHQLHQRRVRAAERRADVPVARRRARRAPRGPHRDAALLARQRDRAARAPVPRRTTTARPTTTRSSMRRSCSAILRVYEFEVDGRAARARERRRGRHLGRPAVGARSRGDRRASRSRFWGDAPYDRYVFLNLITEASGGLEHLASTVLMTTAVEVAHAQGLSRVARPREPRVLPRRGTSSGCGPWSSAPSPTRPRTTRAACGSPRASPTYYGDLLVRRAGLSTDARVPGPALGRDLRICRPSPGRLVQSLTDASFDAWIKHYRPDENSPNTAVSYYTKGALVAFLLDIEIRRASGGARSLDDVLRLRVRSRYAGERGYTDDRSARSSARWPAPISRRGCRTRSTRPRSSITHRRSTGWVSASRCPPAPEQPQKAWLGVMTRNDGGRLVVAQVRRDTPALRAGSTSRTRSWRLTATGCGRGVGRTHGSVSSRRSRDHSRITARAADPARGDVRGRAATLVEARGASERST